MRYLLKTKFFKNFSSIFFAQLIYKGFAFGVMIFLARYLGAQGFGEFSYGLSFVWAFLFISDIGLSELFIRDVAADKKLMVKYVNNSIALKLCLAVASYVFLAILAMLFCHDGVKFLVVMILGAAIIIDSNMYFFRCFFRVQEKMHYEAALMLVEIIFKCLILIIVFVTSWQISRVLIVSFAFLLVSAINLVITLGVFLFNYRTGKIGLEQKFWGYLLANGFTFVAISILGPINFRVDVLMLSALKDDIASGWFSANYRIIEQVYIIPFTIAIVSLPMFSRLSGSKNALLSRFNKLLVFQVLTGIFFTLLLFCFGSYLIKIIFGQEFFGAAALMPALSFVVLPLFMKPLFEKIIFSLHGQILLGLIYGGGLLLNILLNFVFIPRFGVSGASYATILTEMTIVILSFLVVNNRISSLNEKMVIASGDDLPGIKEL
ncbi:MAG: flippase [Candidatus Omnitrophica bacterium]|nr:flippase [Candidatus Omnitrophota bacterium]